MTVGKVGATVKETELMLEFYGIIFDKLREATRNVSETRAEDSLLVAVGALVWSFAMRRADQTGKEPARYIEGMALAIEMNAMELHRQHQQGEI